MRTCLLLIKRLPVTFIVALFFISCGQSRKEVAQLLAQAEAAPAQYPDSALHYLNAIQHPTRLNKAQHAHYHLLRVQAKDKAGQDISADTVIGEVKNHFLRKKDFEKATLAAFYEGCVFGKDGRRALQAFLEAENMAEHISDTKRKGLIQHNIGWFYYTTGTNYDEAVTCFKKAADYFQMENHYTYVIASLNLLGTCFLIQGQADSALFYHQQALDIATANLDTAACADILKNISLVYRETGDFLKAKTYSLQAVAISENIPSLLNLAYIYYDLNKNDSAAFYANRVLQLCSNDGLVTPVSVYALLTNVEKKNNNYKKALAYKEEYTDRVFELYKEKERKSVTGIQEKYNLEIVKNKNQQLLIQRLWLFIIATFVVLFLVGGLFFLYYRNSRQKDRLLKTEKERNKLLAKHIDFYKKAGVLETGLRKILENDKAQANKIFKKVCQIMYNSEDGITWKVFYAAINEYYNGLFDRLKQQYPQFTEQEFKICCLGYADYKNQEIADFLGLTLNTIQTKKVSIRKKLGLPPKGDIKLFLTGLLN